MAVPRRAISRRPATSPTRRTRACSGPVFTIDGVTRAPEGKLAFDLTVLQAGAARNLVENPGVESGAAGWQSGGWMPDQASFGWADIGASGSDHSLWISAPSENDVEWATPVIGLVPGGAGYLCGYLKGHDVAGGAGATLAISGTFVHTEGAFGTFDWTRHCTVAPTAVPAAAVACRLGSFGATTSGEMWCDDVSFARLESAFARTP